MYEPQIFFNGNIVAKPEVQNFDGKETVYFRVAVNTKVKDTATNEMIKGETVFMRCVSYRNVQQILTLAQNDNVDVRGYIVNKPTQNTNHNHVVVATSVAIGLNPHNFDE